MREERREGGEERVLKDSGEEGEEKRGGWGWRLAAEHNRSVDAKRTTI